MFVVWYIKYLFNIKNKYRNVSEQECWVKDKIYALLLYGPVIIALIFHYIVLFTAFIKWKHTKSFNNAYKLLFKRLLSFAVVFTIIRLPPTIVRIYAIFNEPPFTLIILHHIGVAAVGFGNGIVWYFNTHCGSIHKNSNDMNIDNNNSTLNLPESATLETTQTSQGSRNKLPGV